MKAKKKLAVLFTAALLALSLGVFAACAEEEHSLSYVGEVPATCTEAGHEAYYLCSHCGKLLRTRMPKPNFRMRTSPSRRWGMT